MSFAHLQGKPWFRPDFSRPAAEQFLMSSPVGTFVIRPSSTPDCLALSQKSDSNEIFHARILCIRRGNAYVGYSIGGDSEVFPSVDALLKRVQPKTKLVAPTQGPPMGGGGAPQMGGATGGGWGQAQSERRPTGAPAPQGGGFNPAQTFSGRPSQPGTTAGGQTWQAPQDFDPSSPLVVSTQIDMGELRFDKELGSGSFGTVYKGQWRRWTVAIKQLKNQVGTDTKEYKEFIGEAELMTRIPPHENVVRFVGVTKPPNLCIVLEFVARGALYDFLISKEQISGELMMSMIKGCAAGMMHLHSQAVVHRDLAARNVLLDAQLKAKLADFGMSRTVQGEKNQTKSDTGPLKWMAPESIKNREYSTKSDVWAFAVTLTECLGRLSEPYPDLEPIQVATRVAYEELRPPIPPGASATIAQVIQASSQRDPKSRPEFKDILQMLGPETTVWG